MKKALLLALALYITIIVVTALAVPPDGPRGAEIGDDEIYLDPETLEPYSGPVLWLFNDSPDLLRKPYVLKDGEEDGVVQHYYENGQIWVRGSYKNGKKCGDWSESDYTVTYDPC